MINSIPQKKSKELQSSLAIELTAMYRQMNEDLIGILKIAEKESWTIDKLMKEFEDKI